MAPKHDDNLTRRERFAETIRQSKRKELQTIKSKQARYKQACDLFQVKPNQLFTRFAEMPNEVINYLWEQQVVFKILQDVNANDNSITWRLHI